MQKLFNYGDQLRWSLNLKNTLHSSNSNILLVCTLKFFTLRKTLKIWNWNLKFMKQVIDLIVIFQFYPLLLSITHFYRPDDKASLILPKIFLLWHLNSSIQIEILRTMRQSQNVFYKIPRDNKNIFIDSKGNLKNFNNQKCFHSRDFVNFVTFYDITHLPRLNKKFLRLSSKKGGDEKLRSNVHVRDFLRLRY